MFVEAIAYEMRNLEECRTEILPFGVELSIHIRILIHRARVVETARTKLHSFKTIRLKMFAIYECRTIYQTLHRKRLLPFSESYFVQAQLRIDCH